MNKIGYTEEDWSFGLESIVVRDSRDTRWLREVGQKLSEEFAATTRTPVDITVEVLIAGLMGLAAAHLILNEEVHEIALQFSQLFFG